MCKTQKAVQSIKCCHTNSGGYCQKVGIVVFMYTVLTNYVIRNPYLCNIKIFPLDAKYLGGCGDVIFIVISCLLLILCQITQTTSIPSFSVNMEKISEKKSIDKIFVKQNTQQMGFFPKPVSKIVRTFFPVIRASSASVCSGFSQQIAGHQP